MEERGTTYLEGVWKKRVAAPGVVVRAEEEVKWRDLEQINNFF